ncbi:hypothetical protein [Pelagibius sp.]|nr:hypothetical protein [Pelagibius sp.]
MIKAVVLLERRGERSAEDFSHWLLKEHLPKLREHSFDAAD